MTDSMFQPWFNDLSQAEKMALLAVHGAAVYGAAPKQVALTRFIRNCIFQDGVVNSESPLSDSADPYFGSVLVLSDLLNELYVLDYRSRVSKSIMPISEQEFRAKTLEDMKTNWSNYMPGFEQELLAELATTRVSAMTAMATAIAILAVHYPKVSARRWFSFLNQSISKHFNMRCIDSAEALQSLFTKQ